MPNIIYPVTRTCLRYVQAPFSLTVKGSYRYTVFDYSNRSIRLRKAISSDVSSTKACAKFRCYWIPVRNSGESIRRARVERGMLSGMLFGKNVVNK